MKFTNPKNDLCLIIDDEYDVYWAYLTIENKIISDCWIANKIDIPLRSSNYYKDNKIPPPALDEFILKKYSFNMEMNISVDWNDQLEEVVVKIDNENCIKFLYSNNRGFNKYLKINCPWGNAW